MVDSSCEIDLGGLEWVVGWEVYGEEEDAALEWTIALKVWNLDQSSPSPLSKISDAAVVKEGITYWTHNGSLPVELRKSRRSALILVLYLKADLPDHLPLVLQSMMKEGP